MRKLVPHWFFPVSELRDQAMVELLEIAENGGDKPVSKDKLFGYFVRLTKPSSTSYNAKFDKKIRKLVPHWFFSVLELRDQAMAKLLEMAENGEDKILQSHDLHPRFRSYTSRSSTSLNGKFDKKMRKLAPHWFGEERKKYNGS